MSWLTRKRTLVPKTRLMDWVEILSDPTRDELARKIWVGQQTAWPAIPMIRHRRRIEQAIQKGRDAIRGRAREGGRQNRLENGSKNKSSLGSGQIEELRDSLLMPPPSTVKASRGTQSMSSTPGHEQDPREEYFNDHRYWRRESRQDAESMQRTDSTQTALYSDSSDVGASRVRPRHESAPAGRRMPAAMRYGGGSGPSGSDRTDWDDSEEASEDDEY